MASVYERCIQMCPKFDNYPPWICIVYRIIIRSFTYERVVIELVKASSQARVCMSPRPEFYNQIYQYA